MTKYVGDRDYTARGLVKGGREIDLWCDNYDLTVSTPNEMRETHGMVIEWQQQQNTPMNDHHTEDEENEGHKQNATEADDHPKNEAIMEQEQNITVTDNHAQGGKVDDTHVSPRLSREEMKCLKLQPCLGPPSIVG